MRRFRLWSVEFLDSDKRIFVEGNTAQEAVINAIEAHLSEGHEYTEFDVKNVSYTGMNPWCEDNGLKVAYTENTR